MINNFCFKELTAIRASYNEKKLILWILLAFATFLLYYRSAKKWQMIGNKKILRSNIPVFDMITSLLRNKSHMSSSHFAESRGFSLGSPVSSHMES